VCNVEAERLHALDDGSGRRRARGEHLHSWSGGVALLEASLLGGRCVEHHVHHDGRAAHMRDALAIPRAEQRRWMGGVGRCGWKEWTEREHGVCEHTASGRMWRGVPL
jgi:hypothetical protein